MAKSTNIQADITFSNASLQKAANKVRSFLAKTNFPINVTVSKQSLFKIRGQISTYLSQTPVNISVSVSSASLNKARAQVQRAFRGLVLPQIGIDPRIVSRVNVLIRSLRKLAALNLNNIGGGGGGNRGGGGGRGGPGGFGGGGGRRNSYVAPLGHISGEVSEFNKSMDAATARVFAFGATAIVLNSVSQSFAAIARNTIEVEKRLTEIQAIAGSTDQQFAKFRDTIFDVASNTGQTFSTVADGAAELARQGLSAAQITERLNASLMLTRISGLAAEDSVAALTAVINGFSSAGLDANEIVNKIVAVDTAFAVSAKDLADGFTRAGSTAEDAGLSFDELLGLITAIQQRTQRGGAVIGNALKTIFTRISSNKTIEDLKALGVQIDASQNGVQKLQALSDAFSKLGDDSVKANQIKEVAGGKYQINIVSAALKDLSSEQSNFAKATETSNKATSEAFARNAELNQTLSAQLNAFVASLTNMSEKIGQVTFAPILKDLVFYGDAVSDFLSNALNEQKGFSLTQGLFDGIGNFIRGPGTTIVAFAFIKIFKLVSEFAREGARDLVNMNVGSKETAAIQQRISGYLATNDGLYNRILQKQIGINSAARSIQKGIQREIKDAERRLKIEEQITAELKKRGAYINANGQIGFDKSKGAKFARKAGEFAQNPVSSLVAGTAIGFATQSLSSDNKFTKQVGSISTKIEKAEEKLASLDSQTQKAEIEQTKRELKDLKISLGEASAASEEFSSKINQGGALLTTSLFALSQNLKLGSYAIGASLALIAKDLASPKFEAINEYFEGLRASFLKNGESVLREGEEREIAIRSMRKLNQALENLNSIVATGRVSFSSQLRTRTSSEKLFDATQVQGTGKRIEIFEKLNDLLSSSDDEETKTVFENNERSITRLKARSELQNSLDDIVESINKKVQDSAIGAGFESVTKIPRGGVESLEGAFAGQIKFLEALKNPALSLLGPNVTNPQLPQNEKTITRAAQEVVDKLSDQKDPSLIALVDLSKQILTASKGSSVLKQQDEFKKIIGDIKNVSVFDEKSLSDLDSLSKSIDSLVASGTITEQAGEDARRSILEFSSIAADEAVQRKKTAFEAINKQKEINDELISDLKSIFQPNVEKVRNLRGKDLGESIDRQSLLDPYSEKFGEMLSAFGIQDFDQARAVSAKTPQEFANALFSIVSQSVTKNSSGQNVVTGGLSKTLLDLNSQGVSPQLEPTLLKNILDGKDITNEVSQFLPRERRLFATPLLEAQKAFSQGRFLEGIGFQNQATTGLGQLNFEPGSEKDILARRMTITSANQAAIIDATLKTQKASSIVSSATNQNADFTRQQRAMAPSEAELNEVSEKLRDQLTTLGTITQEVVNPSLQELGDVAKGSLKEIEDRQKKLNEFMGGSVTGFGKLNETLALLEDSMAKFLAAGMWGNIGVATEIVKTFSDTFNNKGTIFNKGMDAITKAAGDAAQYLIDLKNGKTQVGKPN